jgi:hypothetical protein
MLVFAVTYREALNTITGDWEMKLRQYEMGDEEWEIAHQLCQVLKVSFPILCHCTILPLIMSRFSKTQHSFSLVMAFQTSLLSFLWTISTRFLLPMLLTPNIQAVLTMGKKTLNCYYSKTDLSEVYRIAMGTCLHIHMTLHTHFAILPVLHPRHKLQYFRNAGWMEEWITTSLKIVQDQFESVYMAVFADEDDEMSDKVRTSAFTQRSTPNIKSIDSSSNPQEHI